MHLFFQGYPLRAIAELLQTPEGTVATWKKRDGWDDIKPIDRVDFAIEARMCQLIAKEVKSGGDFIATFRSPTIRKASTGINDSIAACMLAAAQMTDCCIAPRDVTAGLPGR